MDFSYFTFSVFSFIFGVALCSVINLGIIFSLFLILLSGVLFFINKRDFSEEKSRLFIFIIFFLLFFGLGFLRCSISEQMLHKNLLEGYSSQKVLLQGVIVNEPDERENNTKITLEISKFNEIDLLSDYKIKVLVTVPQYPRYNYGNEIVVSGLLREPENFNTENGRSFDYINYLAKDNIFYTMYYPKTELISIGKGSIVKEKLFWVKNSFLQKIQETIPEPQSALLGGLLLGVKQSLGEKLQEDFRKVGLIHIIVLSGYNVTIIADFMMAIFMFLPRVFALSLGSLSIILFAIMVGGSATIIRASIMALLVVFARATGRTSDVTRALFLAAFIMVLHNPQIVVFDPSFQLSFVATLGLIILSPKISEYLTFIPKKFYLRESAVATVSTQIFVLPLLLYMMGELSLVAVVVNLLVLMFVPVTMFFGFLTGLISFVWVILALPFSYVTHFLLSYELMVVESFAKIPFASVRVSYFPFWLMMSIYIIFSLVFMFHHGQIKNKKEVNKLGE
ncbi:MAG: ComEC family competence protein [Candidatus Pacebacteria bacterium]|nr:ComEC family competence protein [Candidatus Paceibacterota bacterium]